MLNVDAARPLVEVCQLSRRFELPVPWLERLLLRQPRRYLQAVDEVSLTIAAGRTLALVGESGCGKSTLARLLVGLLQPSSGEIRFDGQALRLGGPAAGARALRQRMQMVFQDPYASLNPRWRVQDIVAEPLREQGLLAGADDARQRVAALLEAVGLAAADATRFAHQFSGGQRQRISIARALATEPEFLVCDEPTSALDVSVQAQVLNLMKDLQRERGMSYLFISHNLAVVHHMADEVGVMYLGRIVEMATAEALFSRPRHPYTRLLFDAVPDLSLGARARPSLQGEVPNPLQPPSGCAFHPRCPLAQARCRQERPRLQTLQGRAIACHAVEEGRD